MLERIDEKHVVLRMDLNGEVEFAILKREDGKFDLTWTDYVINVWTETYENLSTAMLRASALVKCGETGWDNFFGASPEGFAIDANDFLNTATKPLTTSRKETN
jgi:hypothetical protein